jgi:enoyl-CoA hydratase/carnithine racemase
MQEVIAALEGAPEDAQVIVIAGDGPAFSAGHDLAEMLDRDDRFYDELFEACTLMMEAVHRVPQPVIARVHGPAFAAGCQLVAACDLAVAAESATFATPGVKIGLFCSTPMVPVSRAVGRKRAMEMLLTGEPISARTAAEWGLVNRVVPDEELDTALDELIARLTSYSRLVTEIGKQAFYAQVDLDEQGAYDVTKAVMASNARLDDAQEGMGAFVGKRRPAWTNT